MSCVWFLAKYKNLSFGNFVKFVTLTLCCFDLGSDVISLVWVIMGRWGVFLNASVLVVLFFFQKPKDVSYRPAISIYGMYRYRVTIYKVMLIWANQKHLCILLVFLCPKYENAIKNIIIKNLASPVQGSHISSANTVERPLSCTKPWISTIYRKFSNIRCTKSQNLNVSHLGLQLSLRNILKPSVKWRMKM